MQRINRRKFALGAASAAACVSLGVTLLTSKGGARRCGPVRIVPLAGVAYSESFLRFIERARFRSARDAVASVRDASLPVAIECDLGVPSQSG